MDGKTGEICQYWCRWNCGCQISLMASPRLPTPVSYLTSILQSFRSSRKKSEKFRFAQNDHLLNVLSRLTSTRRVLRYSPLSFPRDHGDLHILGHTPAVQRADQISAISEPGSYQRAHHLTALGHSSRGQNFTSVRDRRLGHGVRTIY